MNASSDRGAEPPFLDAPADCRRCGVCCFSALPIYVRVTGEDWARLGDRTETLAHFVGHRAYLRMTDGHCAALEIRADAEGRPDYFCSIYARRPAVCRELDRGSPECAGERAAKAERVAERGAAARF